MPSVSTPPQDVSFSAVNVSQSKSDFVPPLANNAVRESIRNFVDVGSPRPLGKRFTVIKSQIKKIDQRRLHSPKHSRSSKAFRKVMNRLSFLPSKRELAASKD